MLDREKRLNEVYEHVHRYFNIHTKGEFADYLKYARAYISSAMNGNEKYLTDKLFDSICKAFPNVFNLDYLLTGKGSLLTVEEEVRNEDVEKLINPKPVPQPEIPDYVKTLVETATNIISRGEEMNQQTASLIRELQQTKKKMDTALEAIEDMKSQLAMMTSIYGSTQQAPVFPMTVNDDGSLKFVIHDFIGLDGKSKKKSVDQLYALVPQGLIHGGHPSVTDEIVKQAAEAFKKKK